MTHRGFYGMTESGKTTLAAMMAAQFKLKGINVLVLDHLNDKRWQADFITDDPGEFLKVAKQNTQCALFVDEGSKSIGRYAREMEWVTTMSRHYGHEAHLITQMPQQLDTTVRSQISEVYLFCLSDNGAKIISNDFAKRELLDAPSLPQGAFFFARRFRPVVRAHLDFAQHKIIPGHPATFDTLPK